MNAPLASLPPCLFPVALLWSSVMSNYPAIQISIGRLSRMIARRIAREIGLHAIHTEIISFKHEIAHCSCGWQRALYSGQQCQRERHHDFIQQHLAEAAGASPKTYTDEALNRAIAAMDETFGQQRTEGT